MQRALGILIGLFWLVHGLVPALPTYVCSAMGGVRMMAPCCADEASHAAEHPAMQRDVRCCEAAPAVTIDAREASKLEYVALAAPPVAAALPAALPMPACGVDLTRAIARGDPVRIGPAPPLHRILRI